jgi:hypothetical protein
MKRGFLVRVGEMAEGGKFRVRWALRFLEGVAQVLIKHEFRKLHQRPGERETERSCRSQRNAKKATNGCNGTRKCAG